MALALVIAVLPAAWVASTGFGTGSPEGLAFAFLVAFWYVGVIALVIAAALRWRRVSGPVARALGFIGVIWVAFLVAYPVIYMIGYGLTGPRGP